VIAVLGFFLTEQIADGLLVNAETSARAQALTGLSTAQSQTGLTAGPTSQIATQVMGTIGRLLQPTNGTASYNVAVGLNTDLTDQAGYPLWAHGFDADDTLPAALQASVQDAQTAQEHGGKTENLLYYAPTTLFLTAGGQGVPAIAYGVPLNNVYQLYF